MSDTMTERERLLAAIEFKGPDRCPIQHYLFPGVFWKYGQKLLDLLEQYPDDFDNEIIELNGHETPDEGDEMSTMLLERNEWGVVIKRLHGYTGGEMVEPAIPTWDDWKSYKFPPPQSDRFFEDFAARVRRDHPEKFVMGHGGLLFQHLSNLRGPANLYMDLAEDNTGINELADRMVEYMLYHIERYIKAGADCIGFGDDWGSQDRLLIHPTTWRHFFKPRYKRMFEVCRDAGVHVWFHTDGCTEDIFEDFMEIGITVLNPQHTIMGTQRVGQLLGGRVCIRTDIDRQHVIPFGTPQQVTEAVKDAVSAFGTFNGGCLLHGEVGPDTPFENIVALYSAFYKYGQYPLDWLTG
jgi:uroporphyrinogen decarboxylase